MAAKQQGEVSQRAEACGDKSSYHHGNLRVVLVNVAIEILEQEGAEKLGLRAAARRAGVSQAAPYHHFGSKEGLLAAVAAEGFRRLAASQLDCIGSIAGVDGDPGSKISELGRSYIRFARQHPKLYRLMFGPMIENRDTYPELVEAYTAGYGSIEAATAEYLEAVGANAVSVKVAVSSAWAMVHGLSHLLNDGKIVPGEEGGLPDEDELVEIILSVHRLGLRSLIAETEKRVPDRDRAPIISRSS